jgi:hypothetical protein
MGRREGTAESGVASRMRINVKSGGQEGPLHTSLFIHYGIPQCSNSFDGNVHHIARYYRSDA